jgi:phosphatidylinositol alpha-mannosyltransferase
MAKTHKLSVGLVFDDSLDRPDGVAHYVKTLGAWLSKNGHSVSYLVGETKIETWAGGQVFSLSKNLAVNFNGNRLSIPLPGSGRQIKRLLRTNNFDVLHVMVPYSPFMAAKVIKAAPATTAVVGTFHIFPSGPLSKIGSRMLWAMLRPTLKCFDQIVAVSSASAKFAKNFYRIDADVIPNPVQIMLFKKSQVKNENMQEIVFLGRLVKRKGVAELIAALYELTKINQLARLVIAGAGPQMDDLKAKVARLGLSDKVKFLGYIDEKDKPAILGSAAIACFPALYGEAFGIVLIEAMAAGTKVVIGGNNPGYASVLGGRPELLIDPKDTKNFAQHLDELLNDHQKRQQINDWQQKEVKKYDIDVVGRQISQIYDSAIARLAKNRHNKSHE